MWLEFSKLKYTPKDQILEDCILAGVGYASGHFTEIGDKKYPVYCSEQTLQGWAELIKNSNETLPVTLNHSGFVQDQVAEIVKDSVKIVDGKLVAAIRFLKVAFERSTNFIAEYIMSLSEEDNSLINISVEAEGKYKIQNGYAEIIPTHFDAASFVMDGALTSKLQNFAKIKLNNNIEKEITMPDDIKKEEDKKVEEVAKAEPVVEPAKVEPEKEEVKAEEAPVEPAAEEKKEEATPEPKLADVMAKLDALMAIIAGYEDVMTKLKAFSVEQPKVEEKKPEQVKMSKKATEDVEIIAESTKKESKIDLERARTDVNYYMANKKAIWAEYKKMNQE